MFASSQVSGPSIEPFPQIAHDPTPYPTQYEFDSFTQEASQPSPPLVFASSQFSGDSITPLPQVCKFLQLSDSKHIELFEPAQLNPG